MPDAQEIYAASVRQLPPEERLRLAALILDDLTRAPSSAGWGDSWSEEDMHDLTAFSLRCATPTCPKEQDLV